MTKRVLFAGLFHETNTFLEQTTGLDQFQISRGEQLLRCAGDSSPIGGALEAGEKFGWTIVPTVDFRAAPSGTVTDEVIETFWGEFVSVAKPELDRGLDAIYLVLHGAMVSQTSLDVEGEILGRIRQCPGAADIRIFGVFDLHANFTERMAANSNCLVSYRENPHTDARAMAQHAAELLERSFQTGEIPRTYWMHPPIVWPPTGTGTAAEPMRLLEQFARRTEIESERIWAVNVMAGFSFADMLDTGVSFSVASTGSESEAREKLEELSRLAMTNKEQGNIIEPSIEQILPAILSSASEPMTSRSAAETSGLTVLVEPSDNIGAGAPGDGTCLLRALIDHKVSSAAIAINDPEAVALLSRIQIGSRITLSIGGKGSVLDPGPIELAVELVSRSDGRFALEDKQSHLASMAGDTFEMGPCAVVRHEGLLILLTSRRTPPFDLGQWRSQGIHPEKLSVIAIKAAVAHRRAYDPIASRMFWVGTPGPCTSNLKTLPYRRIRRPIYPLD